MTHAAPGFRLTGRHVFAGITLFFLVIIGLDVLFASLAYRTFSGEAASNPYETGLLYNRTLEKRRAEAALGWSAAFEERAGMAVLSFTDRDGRPIDGLAISAALVRPATESGRRSLLFRSAGRGLYQASLDGFDGAWDLTAQARNGQGDLFEVEHRMIRP